MVKLIYALKNRQDEAGQETHRQKPSQVSSLTLLLDAAGGDRIHLIPQLKSYGISLPPVLKSISISLHGPLHGEAALLVAGQRTSPCQGRGREGSYFRRARCAGHANLE